MTMFVGLGTASAATYSTTAVPSVQKGDISGDGQLTVADAQSLASIIFDFPVLGDGTHKAVVKLPDGFIYDNTNTTITDLSDPVGQVVYSKTLLGSNQLQIDLNASGVKQKIKFALNIKAAVPSSADAEIKATIIKLDGDFTDGIVTVAKTSAGAVDVLRTDPGTLQAGTSAIIPIHIREDVAGALAEGNDSLKFKLPKGVTWDNTFSGYDNLYHFPGINVAINSAISISDDTLSINIPQGALTSKGTYTILTKIIIDADEAQFGDIVATISGKSTANQSSVLLGTYKDYGYTVKAEKPETEVIAGRDDAEISKIIIKENVAGSLVNGRTVTIKLPDGVEFADSSFNGKTEAGNLVLNFTRSANDKSKATATVSNSGTGAGEVSLKNVKVKVAVDFTGDIVAKFSGSAGINDEIVVAKAVAPVTVTAEAKDVKIGVQGQPAGNIVIKENKAEALIKGKELKLSLPDGAKWDQLPVVKVTEGDLQIDSVTRSVDNKDLIIKIKSESSKPSVIEISNIVYTLDRTVPEGALKVSVWGEAVDVAGITNRTTAASVVAANCVTPAPGETVGTGTFKIGSNIYYVGGNAKVMDVAPYIKNARTYVPMRYLGEILGAEVAWDDAARTVTLTKGSDVVVFTIGSTTYTVNGEAKTADVAPEIVNDRTMLPARFVAEAFGAVVGWDAATQTVLIQK